jgi:hypothetical protein
MTNKKIWLGILALALMFGMTVVGCGGDGDDGGGDKTPYVPITQIPDNYLNTTWVTTYGSAIFFDSNPSRFEYTQGPGFGLHTYTVSPLSSKDQIEKGFDSGLQPSGNTVVISFMKDGSKVHFARTSSWTK